MNKTKITIFFASALMLALLTVSAAGQSTMMVGGYKSVKTTDADIKAAAEFAVKAEDEAHGEHPYVLRLESIKKAERQVVAGMNYKLCLIVGETVDDAEEETLNVSAVIFYGLDKTYKLKSWTKVETCTEKKKN